MEEIIKPNLFEIQPAECRAPLPKKEIIWDEWYKDKPRMIQNIERVLYFDPTPVYERVGHLIDPYKRHAGISMEQTFPTQPRDAGKCTCGCDVTPKSYGTGNYFKYATDNCKYLASQTVSIINNYFQTPPKFISWYEGKKCAECGDTHPYDLQLDHIVGVKQGGGGCWLSNYRWLCHECHVHKTNVTFNRKGKGAAPNQIKIEI
jgi:5-methylcytosine-specific restriction endonuclease McrA